MPVIIEVFGTLREKLGWNRKVIDIEGSIKFIDLIKKIPELEKILLDSNGNLRKDLLILVNGIHIQFKGFQNTIINDGDEISIFPPGGGG